MKILEDVSLSNYTTFRLGGTAKKMFVPENEAELVSLSTEYSPRYYIGGGSNLLIDDGEYDVVVSLRAFNTKLQDDGDGCFTVGAWPCWRGGSDECRQGEKLSPVYQRLYTRGKGTPESGGHLDKKR